MFSVSNNQNPHPRRTPQPPFTNHNKSTIFHHIQPNSIQNHSHTLMKCLQLHTFKSKHCLPQYVAPPLPSHNHRRRPPQPSNLLHRRRQPSALSSLSAAAFPFTTVTNHLFPNEPYIQTLFPISNFCQGYDWN